MKISISLGKEQPFREYEADLNIQTLIGQFANFNKAEGKWQEMSARARDQSVNVSVAGKAYKLVSLDSEGYFKLA